MSLRFLEGPHLVLRPLTREDLTDTYTQWLNDEDVCRNNSHAVFPYTREQTESYFESLAQAGQRLVVLAMVDKQSGLHIGNVSLQNIDWISRNAEFAILLGHKDFWGKGLGREAAELLVGYGFERLNLQRIHCGTLSSNQAMRRIAEGLNMTQEGLRRQAIYKNGSYHDIVEYGLLRSEYLGRS